MKCASYVSSSFSCLRASDLVRPGSLSNQWLYRPEILCGTRINTVGVMAASRRYAFVIPESNHGSRTGRPRPDSFRLGYSLGSELAVAGPVKSLAPYAKLNEAGRAMVERWNALQLVPSTCAYESKSGPDIDSRSGIFHRRAQTRDPATHTVPLACRTSGGDDRVLLLRHGLAGGHFAYRALARGCLLPLQSTRLA